MGQVFDDQPRCEDIIKGTCRISSVEEWQKIDRNTRDNYVDMNLVF